MTGHGGPCHAVDRSQYSMTISAPINCSGLIVGQAAFDLALYSSAGLTGIARSTPVLAWLGVIVAEIRV
jgi:hypothetical protein